MSALSVYVAAPFQQAAFIRIVHERLVHLGMRTTSSWASDARGPEDFSRYAPAELRRIALQNDSDLASADVVLLYDPDGSGRETYAEGRLALTLGKPVVWCSRRGISQWRDGVIRAGDLDEAFEHLVFLRDRRAA